jgi:hypothetical protein
MNTEMALINFELASFIKIPNTILLKCWSAGHVAPEILAKNCSQGYDERCDSFSVGVLLFYM